MSSTADGTDPRRVETDPSGSPLLAVGRIGPANGVSGAVVVEPWTDQPDVRFAPGAILRTDLPDGRTLEVEASRMHNGRVIATFAGIANRADAATIRAAVLFIAADERNVLSDPDEFYDTDLVGLLAHTSEGAELGPVVDVTHIGASTYLIVRVDGADRMVPFVAAIVPRVDVAGGVVVIDAPPGLFEI
jgi:16S rRNA processing protein RimM